MRLAALGVLFLVALPGAFAQELRITQIRLQGQNNVVIQYDAQAGSTYLLLQGHSVDTITTPVATNSGPAGLAQFIQAIPAPNRESYFRLQISGPSRPVLLDPASGASDIGVTVRPKATFPKPVVSSSLNSNNFFASFAGHKLAAKIVPANDGTFAWLFFDRPMPSASQIAVTVDGSSIRAQDGSFLDADANGTAGGLVTVNFSTVSVAPIPGTVLSSRIVDPGPDLIPRTADDVSLGGGGFNYLLPIRGVKVFVLGMENNVAYTDATGSFTLTNMPAGDVKVVLDGRTATDPPAGYYFPEMVMDTTFSAGATNGVMTIRDPNGDVVRDGKGVPIQALAMYLPRIASNVLQTVSASVPSLIKLPSNAAYNLPPDQQPYLSMEIRPNSFIGLNGEPLSSAQIGISVVPPELVRDMLPPGLLQHSFDITVQAPGVATFATPAPMTFPNVFNAPPGTKLNFLSFDHTTGRLVIEGTGTVSADGLSVHTDPGTGVTHPGWHAMTPPGGNGYGGGGGGGPPPNGHGGGGGPPPNPKPPKNCDTLGELAISAAAQCALGIAAALPKTTPLVGCAIGFASGIAGSIVDCNIDFSGCEKTIALNTVGTLIGCIPGAGGILGVLWQCDFQAANAERDYHNCRTGGSSLTLAAAAQIPPNIFNEQQALWAAAAEVYAIVLGNPKWTVIDPQDLLKAQAILEALRDSIQPASPGGQRIIPSERSAILQLPSPGNILASDTGALLDRFDQLMSGQTPAGGLNLNALASAANNLLQVANTLQNRGWDTTYDAFLRGIPDLAAQQDQALGRKAVGPDEMLLVAAPFYVLTDLSDGFVQRGRMPSSGRFDQLFLAANAFYTIRYVDPVSGWVALTAFLTGPSGSSFTIPRAIFVEPSSPDSDGDGLSDEAEEIVGTDPARFSTCDDGISDFARVQPGLTPSNCLPPPTGVIASLGVPGEAKEVVLEGSTSDAQQQTAYLACGSRGLSIIDASNFQMPILLAQLDLPGDAVDVAVDSNLKIAVVAASDGGLHSVDVSDPLQPKLLQTLHEISSQVEAVDGILFAAIGSAIRSYDMLTGEHLQTLALSDGNLNGLAREGSFLYTIDSDFVIRAIDNSGPVMVAGGSLAIPIATAGSKIFVGNGIAYIAEEGVFPGGFATANVSNPTNLFLLSDVDSTSIPAKRVVANGSGLLVSVGSPAVLGGNANLLEVLNVSNPSNTAAFIAQFILPADPYSVAVGAGIGFVADGTAGLQVVNYRAFDNLRQPPVVTMSTPVIDVDPNKPGIQVPEGAPIPIRTTITDDVQVRNVEWLVNGQVFRNDVSFPFDFTAVAPNISAGINNLTLQARATDTGGNIGLSPQLVLDLVPDTFPPTIISIDPATGSGRAQNFRTVRVNFSEPMDTNTLVAANLQLLNSLGQTLVPVDARIRFNKSQVQFTYASLPADSYQLVLKAPAITDLAGNALAATNLISPFTVVEASVAWINPLGGFWDDPNNWDTGRVPGTNDDVFIQIAGNYAITHRSGKGTLKSLRSENPFVISGGTLTVRTTFQVNNDFAMTGGTLAGATILPGGCSGITVTDAVNGQPIFDGVTLARDLTLRGTSLKITHGLTLLGVTLTVDTSTFVSPSLVFSGSQTLGGSGEVVFVGSSYGTLLAVDAIGDIGAIVTIGTNITVHASSVAHLTQSGSASLINQGTIAADTAGQRMAFVDGSFSGRMINQGTLKALHGGILQSYGLQNTGTILVGDGSTLTLGNNLEVGWTNAGTISATNATVNLGGTFTLATLGRFHRSGGDVFIYGTFDNTGTTLALDATTGSWSLRYGTIKGGMVTATGGAALLMAPAADHTLDGVTLAADVTNDAGNLDVKNGLTLNNVTLALTGSGRQLLFHGTQTLGGTGQVLLASSANTLFPVSDGTPGGATLTIGPGITVTETGTGAVTPGSSLDRLINQGTIQALNGGKFTVNAGTFINAGQVTPGNPPQLLDIIGSGSYTQLAAGVLNIHIAGPKAGIGFSQVSTRESVGLDGTLNLILINGYEPNVGDTFLIMTYPSATGRFAVINGLNIGNGKRFTPRYDATGLTLTVVP